nr:hypothetical protein [Tanacetum cinerariifolium]
MAQSQSSNDVHQDELCPPNKSYALMDANKKVDLENSLCPDESRILTDILNNHPLRFIIAASSSTLCKMFSRCLTTRVIGYDQPSVQIM